MVEPDAVRLRIPRWLLFAGGLAFPGTVALMLRIVWEETFLTAEQGPQMVGFSLAHGPLVFPLAISALALHLWVAVMVIMTANQLLRRRRVSRLGIALTLVAVATALPLYVPYGWWRYLILRARGPGQHAGAHITYAAAYGETYNVLELLRQGVAVDTPDSSGNTALGAACVEGERATVQLLREHGADVNWQRGILARTPLMQAVEMGHLEIVEYLLQAGADVSITDTEGSTAPDIARRKGNTRATALLERVEQH